MDTITHALSGALLARATAPGAPPGGAPGVAQRVMAGGLAAAFPDVDIVTSLISPIAYLTTHRGVTHSIVVLPVWAMLLAAAMALVTRRLPGWRAYVPVCALGLAIHIAGDWITSFGTMVLAPMSDMRFALGTTFIIDLILSGIIVAGLLASVLWRRSRLPAAIALCTLVAYIGMQAWLKNEATEVGLAYAATQRLQDARVLALPRPPLPVNWTIVVEAGDRYRIAHVNLWRRRPPPSPPPDAGLIARMHAGFLPPGALQWTSRSRYGDSAAERALARAAWQTEGLRFYRWFAELPAVHRIDTAGISPCVWFEDLRFRIPGRASLPFRYGVCEAGENAWRAYKLSETGAVTPVH